MRASARARVREYICVSVIVHSVEELFTNNTQICLEGGKVNTTSKELYSVVVNIMKFYRHDRDTNPDRFGENQTC